MKTKGIMLVNPLMSQMEIGQEGYLDSEAIILIENELFIDTSYSVLEVRDDKHLLPIKRLGPEKDEYEVDFNVVYYFCNRKLDKKEKKDLAENENIIGPYKIETEIYKPSDYRNQTYPRLDLDGLIETLITINELLEEGDKEDIVLRKDKEELKKHIKEKLCDLPLALLKEYQRDFLQTSEEEIIEGRKINYAADEDMFDFIKDCIKKIKKQKKLEETSMEELETVLTTTDNAKDLEKMSIKELETELTITNNAEDFERSAHIRDIINSKK